jgi:hypothetical protein
MPEPPDYLQYARECKRLALQAKLATEKIASCCSQWPRIGPNWPLIKASLRLSNLQLRFARLVRVSSLTSITDFA